MNDSSLLVTKISYVGGDDVDRGINVSACLKSINQSRGVFCYVG